MNALLKKLQIPKISLKRKDFVALVYWFLSIMIWELCCHFVCYKGFSWASLYIIPFSGLFALILTFLTRLCTEKWNKRWTVILTVILIVFYGSQIVYHRVFGGFYSVKMIKMGGTAMTKFWKETLFAILGSWWKILILFLPVGLHMLRLKRFPRSFAIRKRDYSMILFAIVILVWAGCAVSLRIAGTKRHSPFGAYHSSTIVTKESVNKLGMITTMRLEIAELLFPSSNNDDYKLVVTRLPKVGSDDTEDKPTISANYGKNQLNIDFENLDTYSYDERVQELNRYFSYAKPTSKNQYTGRYKGYNLIEICAESYAPVLIREDLTPTLYQLTHEGFVFENYYTSFQNTTTNCEYTLCMGLFPDLTRNKYDASFIQSASNYLPYCVGNAFRSLGYNALFFHNNVGDFYKRNLTHPNMGFDCLFKKADLEDPEEPGMTFTAEGEPTSDLEMIQQSLPLIYERGEPFVAYYMSYSGHYAYDFKVNPMSQKNQERIEQYLLEHELEYSDTVKAYLACNLELEDALTELIASLRENGMLERTVIVLTGDHYPYGLIDYQYNELAGEELEEPFGRMKNSFILWSGDMEGKEPIVCSEYCCNIDILPTLLNIFGIRYDSRLLAGVDVFSDGPHMAILTDESFMTDVMMFDSTNNQITYKENIDPEQVPKNYFDIAVQLIQNKMNLSNLILYTNYYDLVFHAKTYVSPDEEEESGIPLGYILLMAFLLIFVIYQIIRRLMVKRRQALEELAEQEARSSEAGPPASPTEKS